MTQKDIRDIAAYWGSLCRFSHAYGEADRVMVSQLLWNIASTKYDTIRLYLRPIQSLTDEELTECARIDAGGEFRHGGVTRINRYSDELQVIYGNGASVQLSIPHVYYADQNAGQVAETIAYLQSIGVYVPGTIDEKYVELV